jgi:hypothetical protein
MAKRKKNKGVFQPGDSLEKLEKKGIAIPMSPPARRSVRYRCMRIKNGNWTEKDGLKELIEKQFEADMAWDNFPSKWDVDKEDPYKVIRM